MVCPVFLGMGDEIRVKINPQDGAGSSQQNVHIRCGVAGQIDPRIVEW